jgi:hypothetical protein
MSHDFSYSPKKAPVIYFKGVGIWLLRKRVGGVDVKMQAGKAAVLGRLSLSTCLWLKALTPGWKLDRNLYKDDCSPGHEGSGQERRLKDNVGPPSGINNNFITFHKVETKMNLPLSSKSAFILSKFNIYRKGPAKFP